MNFDMESMLAEARRRSPGLEDFGAEDFRPALQALLQALTTEAQLSVLGQQLLSERIIELLRNRLVVEAYFKKYPQIAAEPIVAPLVIIGLPRTGTTLLQRILSCDRRFYPLLWWETRFPAPLTLMAVDQLAQDADQRRTKAKTEVTAMLAAMPKLQAIHPLDAEAADEEGMLLEHSFQSFFDAYADIPDYTAWLWTHDQAPAYAYLRRLLQFLQWQKRQRNETASSGRWILKTPHHLRQIDVLCQVFADAQVIQTHRDPLQTIPSIASFNETLWQIYGSAVDPQRVGQQWSAIFARGMAQTLAYRERSATGRFLDVWFEDTLQKPLDVVAAIYDFAGLPLPTDVQANMQAYLEHNRREQRPAHDYSLAHFGLSAAQIEADFATYRQRYILSRGG